MNRVVFVNCIYCSSDCTEMRTSEHRIARDQHTAAYMVCAAGAVRLCKLQTWCTIHMSAMSFIA